MAYSLRQLASTLYINRLFARTLFEVLLLALLIEGLFLSERLISILKIVIDSPVGLSSAFPLLAFSAAEVHLALPLAILIATYRIILTYRENREFIALASGGQSVLPLLRFAGALAVTALICSLLISGFAVPHAKFAFRAKVDAVRYETLRAGSTPGKFLYFPDYIVYVWPAAGRASNPVFIRQTLDEKTSRIVNASNTEIIDRSSEGTLIIGLHGVTINDFPSRDEVSTAPDGNSDEKTQNPPCDGCNPQFHTMNTNNVARSVNITNLMPTQPRGVVLDEWTTPELLGWMSALNGRVAGEAEAIEAVRRLARALLCLIAPFLAWSALTLTTRASQIFVLPLACMVVMVADIGSSQLITHFSAIGGPALASVLVAVTLGLLALLTSHIALRQNLLIFPSLGRS